MCHEACLATALHSQGVVVILCPNGNILCEVMYQLAARALCHLPDNPATSPQDASCSSVLVWIAPSMTIRSSRRLYLEVIVVSASLCMTKSLFKFQIWEA